MPLLLVLGLLTFLWTNLAIGANYPGKKWDFIEKPEAAGFSSVMLRQAKRIFNSMDSNVFIVVYQGRLRFLGNTDEKLDIFSVRKSF